ncbi:MAG: hypothetical protein LBI61_02545 [Puniceicoccales bacterium]|jgi:L-lactate dehydrogenase|nr:hypothetical protein [Puniceicoccales bacterium]
MKIGIVGVGNVGAAAAFLLAVWKVADEIVLINKARARAVAEALDISHALPEVSDCVLRDGDYADLRGADIVLMACGIRRNTPTRSRLELLDGNIPLCAKIMEEIVKFTTDAILIVVTNPVDIVASALMRLSGFPRERIISSGTALDSARFETILASHFHVPLSAVHGDVLGEHGDSQVPIWSSVRIFGQPVEDFAKSNGIEFSECMKSEIAARTKSVPDEIVACKHATYYGIAGVVAKICKAIGDDARVAMNVSTLHENFFEGNSVFLSTPTVVCARGATEILPLKLTALEWKALVRSADVIEKYSAMAWEVLE